MDGFGSRWTPGGFSEAMRPTADRPSVVPNDGGPRAWAVTGHGRARPATPPVSRRARGPNNARRDAPRRTTCRRTPTRPRQCEARWVPRRGMSGCRVRGALAQGGYPHRAAREWEGQKGAEAQVAEGDQSAQGGTRPYCAARRPEKRPGSQLCWQRNGFRCDPASPSGSKLGFGAVPKVPLAAKRISVQ